MQRTNQLFTWAGSADMFNTLTKIDGCHCSGKRPTSTGYTTEGKGTETSQAKNNSKPKDINALAFNAETPAAQPPKQDPAEPKVIKDAANTRTKVRWRNGYINIKLPPTEAYTRHTNHLEGEMDNNPPSSRPDKNRTLFTTPQIVGSPISPEAFERIKLTSPDDSDPEDNVIPAQFLTIFDFRDFCLDALNFPDSLAKSKERIQAMHVQIVGLAESGIKSEAEGDDRLDPNQEDFSLRKSSSW